MSLVKNVGQPVPKCSPHKPDHDPASCDKFFDVQRGVDYAVGINPNAANGGMIALTDKGRAWLECRYGQTPKPVKGDLGEKEIGRAIEKKSVSLPELFVDYNSNLVNDMSRVGFSALGGAALVTAAGGLAGIAFQAPSVPWRGLAGRGAVIGAFTGLAVVIGNRLKND